MKTGLQATASSLIGFVVFGLLLLWPAATFDYWQAWVLIAIFVVVQNSCAAANINVEADQKVVSTGLYGLVRHPMYVGLLTMMVGNPPCTRLLLGTCRSHPHLDRPRVPQRRRGKGTDTRIVRIRRVHAEGALPLAAVRVVREES
jgi:hypothetical protein